MGVLGEEEAWGGAGVCVRKGNPQVITGEGFGFDLFFYIFFLFFDCMATNNDNDHDERPGAGTVVAAAAVVAIVLFLVLRKVFRGNERELPASWLAGWLADQVDGRMDGYPGWLEGYLDVLCWFAVFGCACCSYSYIKLIIGVIAVNITITPALAVDAFASLPLFFPY